MIQKLFHLVKIPSLTHRYCTNLRGVFFEEGSELVSLERFLFESCRNLRTIEFPENSSLKSINESVFYETLIESIFIPKSVEELQNDWNHCASNLISVTISPENPNFKHEIMVGKSDKNDDVFDTIYFTNRTIRNATIPKSIKDYAFSHCHNLSYFELEQGSKLFSIGNMIFNFFSRRKSCKTSR